MKILITGGTGQVGWELARSLLPLGDITVAQRAQADFTNPNSLRDMVRAINPDLIVNAAAYTAVDKAETESVLAHTINAEAVAVLAEQAEKCRALLIHYSTDYVFDGTKNGAYDENDATKPLNSYGHSKLAGEQAIQATQAEALILRTTWVYAARGNNFVKSILRLAAEREELNIVSDQIGAPTWARLLAESTAHIVRQAMNERQQGLFQSDSYHLTATGETSWYGFAQAIVAYAREHGISLNNKVINPISTSAYPLPATRPANSRLAVVKLEQHFGLTMPHWQTALHLCLADML